MVIKASICPQWKELGWAKRDINLSWEGAYPTKIKTQKDGKILPIIKILLWGGGGRIAAPVHKL